MKLGKKGKDVESFVDKLVAEGESGLSDYVTPCIDDPLPCVLYVCFDPLPV